VPDTPTPSSLDAAIQVLKQAQQAEADAKATQEAIRKGLLPELQALTELLGGTVAPPKPPVIPRLTGLLANLPHIPLIYVVVFLLCGVIGWDHRQDIGSVHLPHVGCSGPEPVPGPTPPPTPKGPLRVILVSDSAANMTRAQLDILSSTKVRAWLDANCAKGADGRPAWRAWDKSIPVPADPEWAAYWQAAQADIAKAGTPAVVVIVGDKGRAVPLPDSEDALISTLQAAKGN
jgi:hypothetical protein